MKLYIIVTGIASLAIAQAIVISGPEPTGTNYTISCDTRKFGPTGCPPEHHCCSSELEGQGPTCFAGTGLICPL
ncbi:hypothetical protein BJ912DRAFT_161977 [Pholiota molesta]|nr:hypothetical protein BJ912DRAFT_474350 [Pholiota molesta]KAF8194998.1 hypothetical protein BJ912DRAFT_161977 [Pholiota molesta]